VSVAARYATMAREGWGRAQELDLPFSPVSLSQVLPLVDLAPELQCVRLKADRSPSWTVESVAPLRPPPGQRRKFEFISRHRSGGIERYEIAI
jgi:hypothetical protein